MKADKKDRLKNLLKQAGTDQPAGGFTDSVMNIIETDAVHEAALKALLKQHPAEGPAFNFTTGVMAQVNVKATPAAFQPIISKKGWYAVGAVMMALILIIIATSNSGNVSTTGGNSYTSIVLKYIEAIPTMYALAIVAGAILFLADYLFTQRAEKTALN